MKPIIYDIQLQETKKEDSPRYGKEAEFKIFKQKKSSNVPSSRGLSQSPLSPLAFTEPREVEIKKSGSRCTIM